MKRYYLLVLIILLFAANNFGQGKAPKPTPTPQDDDVVKISTNLIQVDVTVVDAKGKVITDLRPEEIETLTCRTGGPKRPAADQGCGCRLSRRKDAARRLYSPDHHHRHARPG